MPKETILARIQSRTLTESAPGPLRTCRRLTWTYRRDAAGSFTAEFPASDRMLRYVTLKNTYLLFSVGGHTVMRGLVERIQRSMDSKGRQTIVISGRDQLGALAENTVGELAISYANDAPAQVLAAVVVSNQAFDLNDTASDAHAATDVTFNGVFSGETGLSALVKIANATGEHFRAPTDGELSVVWMQSDTPAAPVRLLASGGPTLHQNSKVAIIESIESDQDGQALANLIYPYGAGNGQARLTLASSTYTPPGDFSIHRADNYIQRDGMIADPNVQRAIQKNFPTIGVTEEPYKIRPSADASTGATTINIEFLEIDLPNGAVLDLNGLGVDFVTLSGAATAHANVLNVVATTFDITTDDLLFYTNPIALQAAADQLAYAAYVYLSRISDPDTMISYALTVRGLPDTVTVGQLIPVSSEAPGFTINDDLVITEITRSVDRNGRTPAVLKVAPADWMDTSQDAMLASTLENTRVYQALNQPVSYAVVSDTPTIPANFTDLGDVPASYTGSGELFVKVNVGETGLEFVAGSGGAVDSVNAKTGVVVLDPDDMDDSATTNKFTTASDISKLAGIEALADVTDAGNVGAAVNSASTDDTIDDTDVVPYATGSTLKKTAWSVIKSTLKTYFDTLYTFALIVTDNSITNAKLRDSGALSVIGRSANSSGDPADISASAASGAVLRESGSTLGFGTVATAGIANDAVTFAKMQNIATDSLIGRDTASTGDPENILLNSTLEMDGSGNLRRAALTGDVSASAGSNTTAIGASKVLTSMIADANVTLAKMANLAQSTIIGRAAGAGTGVPTALSVAQVVAIINSTLDHGGLAGLSDDDHTQYLLLAGRSGGQTAKGDTASGGSLTLMSTAHATKGSILFGNSAYDEANDRLGVGITDPATQIESASTSTSATRGMTLGQYNSGAQAYLINVLKARSTRSSPSVVSSGDFSLVFLSKFYDGSSYIASAGFGFKVNGSVSTGNVPVDLILSAGSSDAQSLQNEIVRLYGASGNVGIGALSSVGASQLGVKAGTSSNDAAVGGVLYVDSATYNNSGTGETDLASYTVPANTLSANNMFLRFKAWGTWTSNGNTKTLKLKFGSDSVTIASGPGALSWSIMGYIIRTGAATQDYMIDLLNSASAYFQGTMSRTLSSSNVLKLTGQSSAASNDVTQEGFIVWWEDANT